MGRNLDNKCKQCRREGAKLFLKGDRCLSSKCAIVKRNYIPGVHGMKLGKGGRLTGYGIQLREKQKAKRIYRILEKQFRNYFDKAINKTGDTGANMFQLLEMRFDNAVYRADFAGSRDLARQMIGHGHFLINGKKVTIPSYQLRVKDKITLKEKSKKMELFKDLTEKLKNKDQVDWLAVDGNELSITVISAPDLKRNRPNFDLTLITEFYSR